MEPSENKITINFWLLAIIFASILGSAGLGGLYMTRANSIVKAKIVENKEAARPANLDAIIINDQNCKECFKIEPLLTNLQKANIKLTSTRAIDRTDEEAKTLISKYSIQKIPALILRGEVQKDSQLKNALLQSGDINGDTFVLRQIGGPNVLTATGEIKGKTELTLIGDTSCSKCYDVSQHQVILSRFGLSPETKTVDYKSLEGKAIINKYKITLIPTFVLTGEVSEYPGLVKIWSQVGTIKDGAYIFSQGVTSMGVYKDLKSGKIINPAEVAKQTNTSTKK